MIFTTTKHATQNFA